jgi:hypothetical protein
VLYLLSIFYVQCYYSGVIFPVLPSGLVDLCHLPSSFVRHSTFSLFGCAISHLHIYLIYVFRLAALMMPFLVSTLPICLFPLFKLFKYRPLDLIDNDASGSEGKMH